MVRRVLACRSGHELQQGIGKKTGPDNEIQMQRSSCWRAPDVECRMVSTAWLSGGPDRGTNSNPKIFPDKRSIQEPAHP